MNIRFSLSLIAITFLIINCNTVNAVIVNKNDPIPYNGEISSIHYNLKLSSKLISSDRFFIDHSNTLYSENNVIFTYSKGFRPKYEISYSYEELQNIGQRYKSDVLLVLVDTEYKEVIYEGYNRHNRIKIKLTLFELHSMKELWSGVLMLKETGNPSREQKGIVMSEAIIKKLKLLNYLPPF